MGSVLTRCWDGEIGDTRSRWTDGNMPLHLLCCRVYRKLMTAEQCGSVCFGSCRCFSRCAVAKRAACFSLCL